MPSSRTSNLASTTEPREPAPRAARCTPADLRLQWSSAYSRRAHDPSALERLRARVTATLSALEVELADTRAGAAHDALAAEHADVRAIVASLRRMDAREANDVTVAAAAPAL